MLKSWFTAVFCAALGVSALQYAAADQWDDCRTPPPALGRVRWDC
ncbi:hypothetical protein PF010_g26034 [Phytophthora fragariae]|uniref:RxLR effector protein n=1 Tax=Phytophthora fragariae TaxID=53985 RepID=A0A6G0JYK5_9STRA|nr:hypothetical protein PF003_g16086 [Phytophthora fragariae]KAE9071039.1 hypothetical protein PF010_g26034 [Phytophthora fragariae]